MVEKLNFIEELKWRGMLQDIIPGTDAQLLKEKTVGYIGFDPTADSLGVGNLVQIMTLMHFQKFGHQPIVLLGGATGMIGDPSGKSEERKLLTAETIEYNLNCQRQQLMKFLDFESTQNPALIFNNYHWFKGFSFLDFIRDIGKHITVNYMLSKDSVQKRLESGMSFTEFTYQLVQGFDFYHLFQREGVLLQMGGSDQWGNMLTGVELIRRKLGKDAFALTTPLIKKADGSKFGKSEAGNIWLDPQKTSPYQFYQFWLNASDEDAITFIKIFTLFDQSHINNLIEQHQKSPHLRLLQKELAKDITIRVHGNEAFQLAVDSSELLFGQGTIEQLKQLSSSDFLTVFNGVPVYQIAKDAIEKGPNVVELLAELTKVFPSKGEARKMIDGGGVSINKLKIANQQQIVTPGDLLNNKFMLVQKGKKNYFVLEIN